MRYPPVCQHFFSEKVEKTSQRPPFPAASVTQFCDSSPSRNRDLLFVICYLLFG